LTGSPIVPMAKSAHTLPCDIEGSYRETARE
jgi:hypothetical protein